MRPRRKTFNPKREIRPPPLTAEGQERLDSLAKKVGYGGNPEHKNNHNDFGLTPLRNPRPGKTLCDTVGIFERKKAIELLRAGVRKGMVSNLLVKGWPKNIWAVDANGFPLEAQLENAGLGTYHGYPMPESDPFRDVVMERWGGP